MVEEAETAEIRALPDVVEGMQSGRGYALPVILLVAVVGTLNFGSPDRGLRAVHGTAGLGLGAVRLGLRPGLVPRE